MAPGAVLPQVATVLTNMAVTTKRRQAQVRLTEVGAFHADPVLARHPARVVAFLAGQGGMFAFQSPSGLAVIEAGLRHGPPHQSMLPPIVFRMTTDAVRRRLRSASFDDARMVAAFFSQAALDLFMTIKALELHGAPAQRVTGAAL